MIDILDSLQAAFENCKEVLVRRMYDGGDLRSAELVSEFKEDDIFTFLILLINA